MKHGKTNYLTVEERLRRLEHLMERQREIISKTNNRVAQIRDMRKHYLTKRRPQRQNLLAEKGTK